MAQQIEKSLAVVSLTDAVMTPLTGPAIRAHLTRLLVGSNLSPDDLLLDLAAQMTANPALKDCTPNSLFGTLVYAARHHLTFGAGGVWPVPYGDQDEDGNAKPGPKVCTPQLDYRAKQKISRDRYGVLLPLTIEFVFPGEKFNPIRRGGKIVEIEHEVDYKRDRTKPEFTHAYVVAERVDADPVILVFGRPELDRRRQVSKAKSPKAPWAQWTMEMYRKTASNMAEKIIVPDFAAGMGSGGGQEAPERIEGAKDITAEVNTAAKPQTQSERLIADLKPPPVVGTASQTPPPAAEPPPPPADSPFGGLSESAMEDYRFAISQHMDVATLMKWWKDEYQGIHGSASQDQENELLKARDERKAHIEKHRKPSA